ncbi:SDR family NAD(P)-dependent oxidoreductase [Terribacillus sp. AE2B 122]|uniref:SDR family NAD(P)-dependent oxidoreductase n=1 Tax=Terribacillus sp. AE2B 122 TaxID=1331902 RepID=UPI001440926B|nr:glucose 1-dehydrogenase [Terribacillus sp. AE2B 122]VVM34483.1 3-oxoacyl-[acyl-carrier protein] reductase (EC 1.1.1.100) [Terribacillus sp. AE2B 122]
MKLLEGKVAIITGGSKGMGEAHTRKFIDEGAKVVIGDVDVKNGQKLAEDLGDNSIFIELDVTNPESWDLLVKKAKETFGTIDILVNNAGLAGGVSGLLEMEADLYKKIIDINQFGIFNGMRAVLPIMIEKSAGAIINISSLAGLRASAEVNPAYTASKFAVRGLTKQAAYEFADKNIRINSILPGAILTPMAQETLTSEQIDEVSQMLPMKRFANPNEVSDVLAFLASEKASYVNGTDIIVDGARDTIIK